MTFSDWKNKGAYFDYKSHPIFNIQEGTGENLLLIHGFPTASWDWSKMWEQLTTRYRGTSNVGTETYSKDFI